MRITPQLGMNKWWIRVSCAAGISAMMLITVTILAPNGIYLYEFNPYVKVIETAILFSSCMGLGKIYKATHITEKG